jgi:hypothetical protein
MDTPNPAYENGREIRDRTFEFACGMVRLCEKLYEAGGIGRMMVVQLLDCGTSASAMMEEARATRAPCVRKRTS